MDFQIFLALHGYLLLVLLLLPTYLLLILFITITRTYLLLTRRGNNQYYKIILIFTAFALARVTYPNSTYKKLPQPDKIEVVGIESNHTRAVGVTKKARLCNLFNHIHEKTTCLGETRRELHAPPPFSLDIDGPSIQGREVNGENKNTIQLPC